MQEISRRLHSMPLAGIMKRYGGTCSIPRSTTPRMHSTLRTSHFFNSSCTVTASRKGIFVAAFLVTSCVLLGRGKKSTKSTTPSSWMYRVCRIFVEGRYCCLVVYAISAGGEMLKYPPLSLSRSLQKMEGESKSGLEEVSRWYIATWELQCRAGSSQRGNRAYQHIKSTLPSIPTSAQVRILPIKP